MKNIDYKDVFIWTMARVYHQELCTEDAFKDCYSEKRNILSEESLRSKKKGA